MAEIIPLATFDFDVSKIEANIEKLQKTQFDLKKRNDELTKSYSDTQKRINDLNKDQEKLIRSGKQGSDTYLENSKRLKVLKTEQEGVFLSQKDLAIQTSRVNEEYNKSVKVYKETINAEGQLISVTNEANKALSAEIKNKNDAKAANIALNNASNKLNPAIKEEAELLKLVNAQIDKNTDYIKENSSESAKQKLNVGNYTESIIDAYKALQKEEQALQECRLALLDQIDATQKGTEEYKIYIQQLNVLNVEIEKVNESMEEARGETAGLADNFDALGGPIGGFISQANKAGGASTLFTSTFAALRTGILGALQAGLAFIATPIGAAIAALAVAVGAVIGAFKLAKASLESTEKGTQKLAVVTGAITGVFRGLFNIVKPLGLFFANVFIQTLEDVGNAAEAIAEKLANILEFVGAESAAKGIRNFTEEVKRSSVAAANLAKAEGELAVQQRNAQKIQLDYQKQAEKLRQQRDDETKSVKERISINSQLGVVLQKQSASELAIANKQLAVANLRIKAEGETTEALDARAEAETNISDIQERITGQESEQLANLNSLRKEAADAEKERLEKLTEAQLKDSKTRIDAFIAEQGFKRKSAEEEYQFNYDLYNQQYADLKLQLEKKKITQAEFDSQAIQLRQDFLAKNAELTIENSQLELDEVLAKNQRILDSDKFLSESQLALKKQALAEDLKAQQDFEKLRLENGEINQRQYNANINAINEENRQKNIELEKERLVAEQEQKIIDLENLKVTNEENFLAQAEIEKQQNEIKRQQEVTNAEKTGADVSLINAKYAQINKNIEKSVQSNKIQLASDAFGSLASIFGEESKAGKAAAVAQATIDTYKSATSAYSSLAGIPIVGPALGAIAAAAAVAAGIANVKKITSTKTPSINESKKPSYAGGVIGLRGLGTGTSDNISANLSAGESVINARSTSMFANELAAINQAGGGVGINGASNVLTQNTIQNNVNNLQMAKMISEAVAIGAQAGTHKGIKDLSDDRRVMQDAKF